MLQRQWYIHWKNFMCKFIMLIAHCSWHGNAFHAYWSQIISTYESKTNNYTIINYRKLCIRIEISSLLFQLSRCLLNVTKHIDLYRVGGRVDLQSASRIESVQNVCVSVCIRSACITSSSSMAYSINQMHSAKWAT